jgi:hypothetical protein
MFEGVGIIYKFLGKNIDVEITKGINLTFEVIKTAV